MTLNIVFRFRKPIRAKTKTTANAPPKLQSHRVRKFLSCVFLAIDIFLPMLGAFHHIVGSGSAQYDDIVLDLERESVTSVDVHFPDAAFLVSDSRSQ
jgi:hypothetical protein